MTLVEQQLRASVAMPQLIEALQSFLPLAKKEQGSLSAAAAGASGRGNVIIAQMCQLDADKWFEAIMRAECALKVAKPELVEVQA